MVVGVDLEFDTVLLYLAKPSQCGIDRSARETVLLLGAAHPISKVPDSLTRAGHPVESYQSE